MLKSSGAKDPGFDNQFLDFRDPPSNLGGQFYQVGAAINTVTEVVNESNRFNRFMIRIIIYLVVVVAGIVAGVIVKFLFDPPQQ